MLFSMTGFASKNITLAIDKKSKIIFSISLKSLNSRYFEIICKLPYHLYNLEISFIKLLRKKLYRGTIYFSIHIENQNLLKNSIKPDIELITQYLKAVEQIKQKTKVKGEVFLKDILELPDIFIIEEKKINDLIKNKLFEATEQLIKELQKERLKEGRLLEKDITKRIKVIEKDILVIEEISKKIMEININNAKKVLNESDLENIMHNNLDKADIHEEIIRFKSHLGNLKYILKSNNIENGKKMDFTLQELNREINTIAAKSSNSEISSNAINIKVELEKVREQSQNII